MDVGEWFWNEGYYTFCKDVFYKTHLFMALLLIFRTETNAAIHYGQ